MRNVSSVATLSEAITPAAEPQRPAAAEELP